MYFCRVIGIGLDSTVDTAIIGEMATSSSGVVFLRNISELVDPNIHDLIHNVAEAITDETAVITVPTRSGPSMTSGNCLVENCI